MKPDNTTEKKKKNVIRTLRSKITFNIICSIVALLIIFSLIAICIGYWQFSERFTDEYGDNALRIAHAAESYVLPNLDEILEKAADSSDGSFDDQQYLESYMLLYSLCNKVNAEFIYVIKPDTSDYGHITFVYNVVNDNSGFDPYPVGYVRETTNDDYREKYRRLYEKESTEELVVRDKGFIESGSHITAMVPIEDFDNNVVGILCVQRQMDALSYSRITFTIRVVIALAVLVTLAVLGYWFLLNHSLIRPIKKITKEATRFADNPSEPEELLQNQIKSHDEIGVLASSIDLMESETLDYIENLTQATAERQRIGTELELASKIQQSMLNTVFPENEAFEIFASMTPAKAVGGDFYDFYMLDDDHLCMAIADVSGKGIPAALFMTISKIVIKDAAFVISDPAEVLRTVNERICKNNKLDMFVTVWLGILELSTGKVTAANAGHEYPAIYRSGGAFELLHDKHGFVIGGLDGVSFKNYTFDLLPGDAVFVYTDGLPEATDSSEALFGTQRMIDALNLAPDATPFELLSKVQSVVDDFVGEASQFDDLTMLCVKYKGKIKT